VSGNDAKELVREFAASGEGPRLTDQMFDVIIPATELQNLPDYKLYIRTLLDGQPVEPYLVQSFPPASGVGKPTDAATVIKTSMRHFGRDRAHVEQRLHRFLSSSPANV